MTPLEKSSWKTKLIRAPPESSLSERSPELPSMAVRNSAQNSVMIWRITLLCCGGEDQGQRWLGAKGGREAYVAALALGSSERSELLLVLGQVGRDLLLDIGKRSLDVVHEDLEGAGAT